MHIATYRGRLSDRENKDKKQATNNLGNQTELLGVVMDAETGV